MVRSDRIALPHEAHGARYFTGIDWTDNYSDGVFGIGAQLGAKMFHYPEGSHPDLAQCVWTLGRTLTPMNNPASAPYDSDPGSGPYAWGMIEYDRYSGCPTPPGFTSGLPYSPGGGMDTNFSEGVTFVTGGGGAGRALTAFHNASAVGIDLRTATLKWVREELTAGDLIAAIAIAGEYTVTKVSVRHDENISQATGTSHDNPPCRWWVTASRTPSWGLGPGPSGYYPQFTASTAGPESITDPLIAMTAAGMSDWVVVPDHTLAAARALEDSYYPSSYYSEGTPGLVFTGILDVMLSNTMPSVPEYYGANAWFSGRAGATLIVKLEFGPRAVASISGAPTGSHHAFMRPRRG